MNAFYQHHKDNIVFHYGCFDRILLHAFIPPFYQPERVKGFFDTCRGIYPVTKQVLRDIAAQYRNWIANRSKAWGVPVLEQPHQRRDDFIDPYFRRARPDRIVAIIKAREQKWTPIFGPGVKVEKVACSIIKGADENERETDETHSGIQGEGGSSSVS